MSAEEKVITTNVVATHADVGGGGSGGNADPTKEKETAADATIPIKMDDKEREEKLLKARDIYAQGSRDYLMKDFAPAADELSQVCALFEELYGELSDELGLPYLLYAKCLIALAIEENRLLGLDGPDYADKVESEADDEKNDDSTDGISKLAAKAASSTANTTNGVAKPKLDTIKEDAEKEKKSDEADSTGDGGGQQKAASTSGEAKQKTPTKSEDEEPTTAAAAEDAQVSSTDDDEKTKDEVEKSNGDVADASGSKTSAATKTPEGLVTDGERPSTSNGVTNANDETEGVGDDGDDEEEEEEDEATVNLRLAWEILELAAKIFIRQGLRGLPNLAEVQTELGNIQFENSILDSAREDYEKALRIYEDLPKKYNRAMAEIHYKIGLTYLMQQFNKEGAASLKAACSMIDSEIEAIKEKTMTDKDQSNIEDMEETKQEIWAKIAEIEEAEDQHRAEVRAALDSFIKPLKSGGTAGTIVNDSFDGPSSSSAANGAASSSSSAAAGTSKPTDISHLVKRKKPEEPSSEAEAVASPAKRPKAP